MKDFLKVELPDLETITAINESFRQHLFAQWILNKDDEPRFKALTSKLHNLTEKHPSTQKNYLDPTNYDLVNQLGELIVDVEVNKTSKIKVAIPQDLRFALFDGWDNNGFIIIRVLYYYGKRNQRILRNPLNWKHFSQKLEYRYEPLLQGQQIRLPAPVTHQEGFQWIFVSQLE